VAVQEEPSPAVVEVVCLVVFSIAQVVLSPAVAVVAFEADELLHDLGREFGS